MRYNMDGRVRVFLEDSRGRTWRGEAIVAEISHSVDVIPCTSFGETYHIAGRRHWEITLEGTGPLAVSLTEESIADRLPLDAPRAACPFCNCGVIGSPDYCPNCGAPLATDLEPCPKCKSPIRLEEHDKCPRCGTPLGTVKERRA